MRAPALASVTPAEAAPDPPHLPRHIAIVMDGNGRWARKRDLPRIAGHRRGVEVVKAMLPLFGERGIPFLTLFAFSSENWKRPNSEVSMLLDLLTTTLKRETQHLHKNNVRLRVIGDLSRFPAALQKRIQQSVALTRANQALNLTIAINYGGRWDVAQACRALAEAVARGDLRAEDITADALHARLCTNDLPEPDLFIRTGGEQRISNFLLWQLAYTELYFTDTYWPDFSAQHVDQALRVFATRQRRFGKTAEQVTKSTATTTTATPPPTKPA